jgi:predicted phosphoadenosine phosphosulfate sulfurtransferase
MEVKTGRDVFRTALDRIYYLYQTGRVVVSFSAGKDSGVCLELAIIAAKKAGKLPVDVVMRDEEIMYPGTFEYAERCAKRKEVRFHWLIANQPIINVFNREAPYFWVFDPLLPKEKWVRQPPSFAEYIEELNIEAIITQDRFPIREGEKLYSLIGLRTSESMARRMSIFSRGGFINKHPDKSGVYRTAPIYDWKDEDVWKFVLDYGFDYNKAYDVMYRIGTPKSRMRIAPPTMNSAAVSDLGRAIRAWPRWFDKVAERCPGTRSAAQYGRRAVEPVRRLHESWEDCYQRTCIDEAPQWIADRSKIVREKILRGHANHSTEKLPEVNGCSRCGKIGGSWKAISKVMYNGDPFSMRQGYVGYVEPDFFRPGSGKWNGGPTW